MGSGESKPNNLEQTKDHILKEIDLELENTSSNLLKCQSNTETTILTNHRKHVKELKTKLTAFYKSMQISNKVTTTIISKNLSLQVAIDCCKTEIYKIEKENQNLKENYSVLKGNFEELRNNFDLDKQHEKLLDDLKEAVRVRDETISKHKEDFNGKIYELNKHKRLLNESDQESKREKYRREEAERKADWLLTEIETLRFQIVQKNVKLETSDKVVKMLKLNKELELKNVESQFTAKLNKTKENLKMAKMKEINMHKTLIEKQTADIKVLQDQLKQSQDNLRDERNIKEDQMTKIELLKQYCDQLINKSEEKKLEQEQEKVTHKEETTQLTNELSSIKTDVVCQCKPELIFVKQCYDNLRKELDIKQTERDTNEKVHKKEINRLSNLTKRLQARLRMSGNNLRNEIELRKEGEVKTKLLEKQIADLKDLQQKLKNSPIEADELNALRLRCSHLEKVIQIKETEHESEKLKFEKEINTMKTELLKLQEDCEQEIILRENLEKHVLMLEKQAGSLKKLKEKLEICQEHLEIEKKAKQNEMYKLQLAKQELELIEYMKNKKF